MKYTICVYTKNKDLYNLYTEQCIKWNSSQDWGFDLFMPKSINVVTTSLIDLEIVVAVIEEIMSNKLTRPFIITPRSSISKTSLRLSNSIGIIDETYNGENDTLKASFDNLNPSEGYSIIKSHSRLLQIVLPYCGSKVQITASVFNDYDKFANYCKISKINRGGFGTSGE